MVYKSLHYTQIVYVNHRAMLLSYNFSHHCRLYSRGFHRMISALDKQNNTYCWKENNKQKKPAIYDTKINIENTGITRPITIIILGINVSMIIKSIYLKYMSDLHTEIDQNDMLRYDISLETHPNHSDNLFHYRKPKYGECKLDHHSEIRAQHSG